MYLLARGMPTQTLRESSLNPPISVVKKWTYLELVRKILMIRAHLVQLPALMRV